MFPPQRIFEALQLEDLSEKRVADSDFTLGIFETNTKVNLANSAATGTLPPVAEARGIPYYVELVDGTNNLTLTDQGDSDDWSDYTLTAADDHVLLVSAGNRWVELAAVTT